MKFARAIVDLLPFMRSGPPLVMPQATQTLPVAGVIKWALQGLGTRVLRGWEVRSSNFRHYIAYLSGQELKVSGGVQ